MPIANDPGLRQGDKGSHSPRTAPLLDKLRALPTAGTVGGMQFLSPQQLLDHHDRAQAWPHAFGGSLQEAYEHQLAVREMRIARGETPRGWKVGFTNRNIWPRYGVFAPMWGTVWDTTLTMCDGAGTVSLQGTCEPRLEPEAVFGIRETPPARASLDDLYRCIEW